VGILGLAYYKGLDEAGVISTAKHFPGHGDTQDDSHGTLPVIDVDLETLEARDLAPYRTLIAGGIPAVMVGHLAYPAITGSDEPATLSSFFLHDILRKSMGFHGIVVTDDLFMRGVRTDGASLPVVCRKALDAGSDLLLISRDPEEYHRIRRHLIEVMSQDPRFAARVREAARRVVEVKAAYLKRPDGVAIVPDLDRLAADVPAAGAESFFLEQACRSVSVVKNERIPLFPEAAGRVMLAGAYGDFLTEGLRRYPEARIYRLPYSGNPEVLRERGQELSRAAEGYDTVVFLLRDAAGLFVLEGLEDQAEKVVVFSILSPVHLDDVPWARTALAAYGTGKDSFAAGFAVLRGDFEAGGRVPIPLSTAP
jgi:beta-N-acetylhexosaminidase